MDWENGAVKKFLHLKPCKCNRVLLTYHGLKWNPHYREKFYVTSRWNSTIKKDMVHKNNFSWIQNFTVSYTGTPSSNSAFTKLLLRFCLPITYQDYFTRYLKSALHSSRTKANQIFAYLEFPTMTKLMNST